MCFVSECAPRLPSVGSGSATEGAQGRNLNSTKMVTSKWTNLIGTRRRSRSRSEGSKTILFRIQFVLLREYSYTKWRVQWANVFVFAEEQNRKKMSRDENRTSNAQCYCSTFVNWRWQRRRWQPWRTVRVWMWLLGIETARFCWNRSEPESPGEGTKSILKWVVTEMKWVWVRLNEMGTHKHPQIKWNEHKELSKSIRRIMKKHEMTTARSQQQRKIQVWIGKYYKTFANLESKISVEDLNYIIYSSTWLHRLRLLLLPLNMNVPMRPVTHSLTVSQPASHHFRCVSSRHNNNKNNVYTRNTSAIVPSLSHAHSPTQSVFWIWSSPSSSLVLYMISHVNPTRWRCSLLNYANF